MAHAKLDDLKDITAILDGLRNIDGLKEKSLGCFYYKSKGILHFHTKASRRYAHVFDGKSWVEVDIKPAPSARQQGTYLKAMQNLLPLKA